MSKKFGVSTEKLLCWYQYYQKKLASEKNPKPERVNLSIFFLFIIFLFLDEAQIRQKGTCNFRKHLFKKLNIEFSNFGRFVNDFFFLIVLNVANKDK